jgi:hypothetical protein
MAQSKVEILMNSYAGLTPAERVEFRAMMARLRSARPIGTGRRQEGRRDEEERGGQRVMPDKTKTLNITVSATVYELLAVLSGGDGPSNVTGVIEELIDHAQQGVYRPGAWEREWLCQAFGYDWIEKLETGDPHGRNGSGAIFQRPRRRRPAKTADAPAAEAGS